jgi:pyrroline-5-carboxylate reductase
MSGRVRIGGVGPLHPPGRTGRNGAGSNWGRGRTAGDEEPATVATMSAATDSETIDLVMIGGGNMGAALLGGMVNSGKFSPEQLAVVELREERRTELAVLLPGITVTESIPPCRSAVLAVKPQGVAGAAAAAVAAGATRLLSIAAGVGIATIEAAVGPNVAVVRCMPNTPALVGMGTSAIAGGSAAHDDDLVWAESILGAVGIVDRLPESQLDVFTGVAGSGPAYVFLVAESLIEAAIAEGFDHDIAERIVTQLLLGASTLLAQQGDPATLRKNVTSPNGTTAAGVAALEERGLRSIFASAVTAATERSRELG